jgi:hypothetical protein
MTHNSEPSADAGDSPFRSSTAPRPLAPLADAVGHSTRVADIIMLTVVVAVLLAIAAHYAGLATPQHRGPQEHVLGGIIAGFLAGIFATIVVQRKIIASLYGAAIGAGLGAAVPSLVWDPDSMLTIVIGCSVMLAAGATLGTLRRRSESAKTDTISDFQR